MVLPPELVQLDIAAQAEVAKEAQVGASVGQVAELMDHVLDVDGKEEAACCIALHRCEGGIAWLGTCMHSGTCMPAPGGRQRHGGPRPASSTLCLLSPP